MALAAAAYHPSNYNTRMDMEWESAKSHHHSPTTLSPSFEQPRRVDTPCPTALFQQQVMSTLSLGGQRHRRGRSSGSTRGSESAAYVLLPDGGIANRRFIELGEGTTVVGRCKSSGIRDHHVSRRHVEVTVPEGGEEGAQEYCRIKYIGRNCRVVVVGGILLKAEQEVAAPPGTRIILNFNNKGLPRYSYTLVPAVDIPVMSTAMCTGRQRTAAHWPQEGSTEGNSKRRTGRFRKEAQEKLQREREEIFNKFADLKFS